MSRDYRCRPAVTPQPADEKDTRKTQAYYALCLHPDLTAAAKAVGAALVDHCNLASGRCDPSITGLAAHAGISRASVFRALTDLAGCGLIVRLRHAGGSHRNAYAIQWEALTTEVARARTAKETAAQSRGGGITMRPSQGCDLQGLRGETETVSGVRPKPLKEPWNQTCSESETVAPPRSQSKPAPSAEPPSPQKPWQRHMMLPIPGGKREAPERAERPQAFREHAGREERADRAPRYSPNRYEPRPAGGYRPSSAEVAREAAMGRWEKALLEYLGGDGYGRAVAAIEPWMERVATRAEMRERGSGAGVVLACLSMERGAGERAERVPPIADTG